MSTPYQQTTRIGELITPLGENKLVLVRFDGSEAMSELFEFRIEALCDQAPDAELDFDALLGKSSSVRITTDGQGERFFTGTIVEAQRLGPVDGGVLYSLLLRPWFWLLGKRVNSRIFHDQTVDDIIRIIFQDHGYAEHEMRLSKSYPQLEYCVQHRESDLDFVCRLMELNGIGYHFQFEKNVQKLILSSDRSGYDDVPGKTRSFYSDTDGNHARAEHLYHWVQQRRFTTGKVTLSDYNFKESNSQLKAEKSGDAAFEPSDLERYSHPGGFDEGDKGDQLAEASINAIRAVDGHFIAAGSCASFAPGNIFSLENHHNADEYLILRCTHTFMSENYRTAAGGLDGSPYSGTYEFMKASRPYAPPMLTPRPFIAGSQTAKVVGDEEIDCDDFGRIKVHFHWNREDEGKPESESMWCRVAQVWSGSGWGGVFIPRKDMEVLVNFIDGDPDRPVIVGTVYNDSNVSPYDPSSDRNTSGWKSQTVGGSGYNEIAMDDTSGNELVRVHGQMDIKADAEHDIDVTAQNEITITAMKKITLTVGTSTIVIDATSISLSAMSITVDAKTDLTTNGGATATHQAGGAMTITAALVKIN